jgi:hypothetical protein
MISIRYSSKKIVAMMNDDGFDALPYVRVGVKKRRMFDCLMN